MLCHFSCQGGEETSMNPLGMVGVVKANKFHQQTTRESSLPRPVGAHFSWHVLSYREVVALLGAMDHSATLVHTSKCGEDLFVLRISSELQICLFESLKAQDPEVIKVTQHFTKCCQAVQTLAMHVDPSNMFQPVLITGGTWKIQIGRER